MIKDIQRHYSQLESAMQGLPASAFNLTKSQSILNEVGLAQIALEADLNTSIAELDDGSGSGKVTKSAVKSSGRDKTA